MTRELGYPPANIVWYKNNQQLFDQIDKISITWELNRATLRVKNVHGSDAGRYSCSASNDAGSASSSADLFVKSKLNISLELMKFNEYADTVLFLLRKYIPSGNG